MKKVLSILVLFSASLSISAQSYNFEQAEIYANRFIDDKPLTVTQFKEAVDLYISGWQEIKKQGERLLEITPEGSDWEVFHRSYESIEKEYAAVSIIEKGLDINLNKIPEKAKAAYTRNKRMMRSWYSDFTRAQRKLANCPYK